MIYRVKAVLGHLGSLSLGTVSMETLDALWKGALSQGECEDIWTHLVLQVSCLQVIHKNRLQRRFWMR